MPSSLAMPVRADALEINILDDGFVVYQPSCDRVHYLNPTAGLLLELCDASLTEDDLARRVGEAWNLSEPPYEEVAIGLRDLRNQDLIR